MPSKSEIDPEVPICQVFRNLHSATKGKTVVPPKSKKSTPTFGKKQVLSSEPGATKPEESQPFVPTSVNEAVEQKWELMMQRDLIIQREADIKQLNLVCDIIPLLEEIGLLSTMTNIGPYSKLLTNVFYCNLTDSINDPTSPNYYKVFI